MYRIHSKKESAASLDRITPSLKLEDELIGLGVVSQMIALKKQCLTVLLMLQNKLRIDVVQLQEIFYNFYQLKISESNV